MATIQDIKQRAQQVKVATQIGENTANRVGGVLVDMADHLEQDENQLSSLYPADAVPTAGSTKPVQSGSVHEQLSQLLPMDAVPTPNSVKPVQSGGVFREVAEQIMTQFGGRFGVKNLSEVSEVKTNTSFYFDTIVDGVTQVIKKQGNSYYRIAYTKTILPKGTIIHFTASVSAARGQIYGASPVLPPDPMEAGFEINNAYSTSSSENFDDYYIMPYDGYFFYAYYNLDWSNRLFEVIVPEPCDVFSTGEKVNETGIDALPTSGSASLVTSGGVMKKLAEQMMTQFGERFGVKSLLEVSTVKTNTSFYFDTIVDGVTQVIKKQGNSYYTITYTKTILPKGTIIHFTASVSAARGQIYGASPVLPPDPMEAGFEINNAYLTKGSGNYDDYYIMPYDGYFFYAFYNQDWSNRLFEVIIPEPYGSDVVYDFINRPYFKQDAQQLVGQWQTNDATVWDISGVDGNNATLTNVTDTEMKYVGFYIGDIPAGMDIRWRFKCEGPLKSTGAFGLFKNLVYQPFVPLRDINGNVVYKDSNGYFDIVFRRTSSQNWIVLPSNNLGSGSTFVISEFFIEVKIYFEDLDSNLRAEIGDVDSDVKKVEGYAGSIIPPVYTHEKYMNISIVTQGSCVYGNYLFGAIEANSSGEVIVKVFDLESKTLTDTLTLSGVATNTHANTLSFGNKFDDNDEFPCLYIPTGFANNGASDVYVCRITGTVGNLSISIIQTIHLWNVWTDFFCGENNMAWVKTGANSEMRFRCYTLPELSESVVTIDPEQTLMDFTLPPQKFGFGVTKSNGQNCMYYKGKIWFVSGVPSRDTKDCTYIAVVDVRSQCLDCVVWLDDVGLTDGNSNTYEPESVFIWNNQLYVAFKTFISKIIRVNLT